MKSTYRPDRYKNEYSSGHARNGCRTTVPDDIKRLTVHEPCFFCGEAKGLCRHRVAWPS